MKEHSREILQQTAYVREADPRYLALNFSGMIGLVLSDTVFRASFSLNKDYLVSAPGKQLLGEILFYSHEVALFFVSSL